MTEQNLNYQDEIKENTSTILGVGGSLLAIPILGIAHKPILKGVGMLGLHAAHTAANFSIGIARGALSDNTAIQNPNYFKFLKDPNAINDYGEAQSLWKQAQQRYKAYGKINKNIPGLKNSAIESYANISKAKGQAITNIVKGTGKDITVHFADGTTDITHSLTREVKDLFEQSATAAEHLSESKDLLSKAGKKLPIKEIMKPGNLYRGIRGWLSNPSKKGTLGLLPYRTLGTSVTPRIGFTLPKMAELTGHAIGRTTKAAGLLSFNVGADLLKGLGKDLFGLKGGGSSGIIRTAKAVALFKAFAPLRQDIYYNSIASETAMEGNPMLTNLANAGARSMSPNSFDAGYGVDMEKRLSASGTRARSVQNDSRSRFIESAAGLSHSLARISGKIL